MAKTEKIIELESIKKTLISAEIIGADELILHQKDRCYVLREIFKQSHDEGEEIPKYLETNNMWQYLITGIRWEKPIVFHDDPELYSEEEYNDYMANNRPCISTYAFKKSLAETFISFGYKKSTGKHGTDLERTLAVVGSQVPVDFAYSMHESKIVNTRKNGTGSNVICHENHFGGWKTHIDIIVPEGSFPAKTVVSLLKTAGEFIGIGSRRKEGFGRYRIDNLHIEDITDE